MVKLVAIMTFLVIQFQVKLNNAIVFQMNKLKNVLMKMVHANAKVTSYMVIKNKLILN